MVLALVAALDDGADVDARGIVVEAPAHKGQCRHVERVEVALALGRVEQRACVFIERRRLARAVIEADNLLLRVVAVPAE